MVSNGILSHVCPDPRGQSVASVAVLPVLAPHLISRPTLIVPEPKPSFNVCRLSYSQCRSQTTVQPAQVRYVQGLVPFVTDHSGELPRGPARNEARADAMGLELSPYVAVIARFPLLGCSKNGRASTPSSQRDDPASHGRSTRARGSPPQNTSMRQTPQQYPCVNEHGAG